MDDARIKTHKTRNLLQSIMLISAMAMLPGLIGWLVAGNWGILTAFFFTILSILLSPSLSPQLILRMYGARQLDYHAAPALSHMLQHLCQRAGITEYPAIYYIPGTVLNAFTIGTGNTAALAITDGLLRSLNPRELNGVLAHEISHLRNNDTWVMGLADLFSRMTYSFSLLGQFLLLVNLPLYFYSDATINWFALLLLVFAPTVSILIQLALCRTREYDADLDGARISGDPAGLAMALEKIEDSRGGFFERIFFPGRGMPEQTLFRTHPPTEERIRRLGEIVPEVSPVSGFPDPVKLLSGMRGITQPPRWHLNGLWF